MRPYTLFITALDDKLPRRIAEEEAERRFFGDQLIHDEAGRPIVIGGTDIEVSISHSKNWLVALFAPHGVAVGVDIEEKVAQASRVLSRYTTPEERRLMTDDGLTPLYLWTAKEALYKAYSPRLSKGVNQIVFVGVDQFHIVCDDGEELVSLVEWIDWEGALIAHNITLTPLRIQVV